MKIISEIGRYDPQKIGNIFKDKYLIVIYKNDPDNKTTTIDPMLTVMDELKSISRQKSLPNLPKKNVEKAEKSEHSEEKKKEKEVQKDEHTEIFKQLEKIADQITELKDSNDVLKNENQDLKELIQKSNDKNENKESLIALIVEEMDKRFTEKIAKSMDSINNPKKKK